MLVIKSLYFKLILISFYSMKKFTQVFVLCLCAFYGVSQEDFNFDLVSNVSVGETGNDVWGWVDSTGVEYAIMGSQTKTTIWSLEDPANPIERATIPGPAGTWRDIKSFEDHLYVTSDQGSQGLLIVDMSQAPDTITHLYWKPTIEIEGTSYPLGKCHNLYIDEEQGFCYLAGCDVSEQGVLILDLNIDKKEPVFVSAVDDVYSHDVFVRDDLLYSSDILVGSFSIYDVSDKSNPIYINGAETSRRFTHNAWLSDDGNYLFTTDERANAWVDAFDISDLNDIQFLDRYRPLETEGNGVIPHNTHYYNGFLVTSWYTDGVVVMDANKPDNLIKVASYDTELVFPNDFEGCWGAYPFLPSGLVLAGDRNHGLFILQPKTQDGTLGYQRACYLEGAVTDIKTGAAIANATVEIISDNPNISNSELSGKYKTGQVTPGEFEVVFKHPSYNDVSATAILISGEVTILDIQMGNTELTGTVKDENGDPIVNASVLIENVSENVSITVQTDEDGNWTSGARENLDYNVYAAGWGYTGALESITLTTGVTVDFVLPEGYEDDFFVDLGWATSGSASSGAWEIARPNFISGSGQTTQTSSDIQEDLGNTYYITGADGSSQGANDIDGGSVVLTSPSMDFTGYDEITFNYYVWFVNVGGNSTPNDFMRVSVTNGTDTIEITRIDQNSPTWSSLIEITIDKTMIEFNDQMQVIVYAEDGDPGHVVEVGFDAFKAIGSKITGTTEVTDLGLSVYPNPSSEYITLQSKTAWEGRKQIIIVDNQGKVVLEKELTAPEMRLSLANLTSGMYSLQIIGKDKVSESIKFSKI